MGEVAFHEEEFPTTEGDRLYFRQIYGDSALYLGFAKRAKGVAPIGEGADPDVILLLSAHEVDQLHAILEGFRWARCTRCDAPADGSKGDVETLLCDDCLDDPEINQP